MQNVSVPARFVAAASAIAMLAALFPGVAQAGEVQNRDGRQQARIDRGVRSGQLTQGEYYRDQNHLDRIEAQRNRDLRANDGHLTARERSRLNGELNRNSERIYYTKHNRVRP